MSIAKARLSQKRTALTNQETHANAQSKTLNVGFWVMTGLLTAKKLPPDQRKLAKSAARAAGSYVPKIAAKAFENYGFHSSGILTDWAVIVGNDIAAVSAPERIRWPRRNTNENPDITEEPATLTLRVAPAAALDVEYRRAAILERINRYFGYRAVGAIKIIQSPIESRVPPKMPGRGTIDTANVMTGNLQKDGPPDGLKKALEGLSDSIARNTDKARKLKA